MNAAFKICLLAFGLSSPPPAHAEKLGRLFFTPEQRAQLEYGTPQKKPQKNDAPVEKHQALTVNGIVQKQGGARTVWINGVPRSSDVDSDHAPESLFISTRAQSPPIKVKVGQKVLVNPAVPVE